MKIINEFDLTEYNSYKIRAKVKTAIFPADSNELIEAVKNYPNHIILGGGNNIIFKHKYYEKHPFIVVRENLSRVVFHKNIINCEPGVDLKNLSYKAYKYQLSGLEYFYDIPGTLGGAIVMNAGSKGEDIGGVTEMIDYFDVNKQKSLTLTKDNLDISYRNSIFQEKTSFIILNCVLKLRRGDAHDIWEKMETNRKKRWENQPRNFPNAGSVFKRPKGYYVGQLIEESGLKGYTIGGAKISEKHAGFIVNYNNATGIDIIKLINYVTKIIYEKYNIKLEMEQKII